MVKECEDTQTHTSTKLKTQQMNFETILQYLSKNSTLESLGFKSNGSLWDQEWAGGC